MIIIIDSKYDYNNLITLTTSCPAATPEEKDENSDSKTAVTKPMNETLESM